MTTFMARRMLNPRAQRLRLSPPPARTLHFFCLLLGIGAALSMGGCATPRTPDSAAPAEVADGGELTCEEKARARGVCVDALMLQCRSNQQACESGCESRNQLPAGTQKAPSTRDELEGGTCRERCRLEADACARNAPQRCPMTCQIGDVMGGADGGT